MAKGDALDIVIKGIPKSDRELWETFRKLLDCDTTLRDYQKNKISKDEFDKEINREIRSNFGHTFVNLFRSSYDPDYIQIVCEVADKLEIECPYRDKDDYDPWWDCYYEKTVIDRHCLENNKDIEDIEDKIMLKYFELMKESIIKEKGQAKWDEIEESLFDSLEDMVKKGKITSDQFEKMKLGANSGLGLAAFIAAGKLSGFAIYKISMSLLFGFSRALGLGLTVGGAGATLASSLSVLLGPVGWAITALSIMISLGNTNWEKTIPAVFMIACIRKDMIYGNEDFD